MLTAFLAKPSGATISFQASVLALSSLTDIPGRLGLTTREYLCFFQKLNELSRRASTVVMLVGLIYDLFRGGHLTFSNAGVTNHVNYRCVHVHQVELWYRERRRTDVAYWYI